MAAIRNRSTIHQAPQRPPPMLTEREINRLHGVKPPMPKEKPEQNPPVVQAKPERPVQNPPVVPWQDEQLGQSPPVVPIKPWPGEPPAQSPFLAPAQSPFSVPVQNPISVKPRTSGVSVTPILLPYMDQEVEINENGLRVPAVVTSVNPLQVSVDGETSVDVNEVFTR